MQVPFARFFFIRAFSPPLSSLIVNVNALIGAWKQQMIGDEIQVTIASL